MSFGDFGDFGDDGGMLGFIAERPAVSGPLVGGGLAQAGLFASKMIGTKWNKPALVKWAPAIGTVLGAGVSALMLNSDKPGMKDAGMAGLITALLVGVPRQLEDMLMPAKTAGYFGVVAPEQVSGYFGDEGVAGFGADEMGAGEVQLLDSGVGSSVLGVIAPEQQMSGPEGVEMMGSGFGSNFLG